MDETFVDRLLLHGRTQPDRPALEDVHRRLTWGGLHRHTNRIAQDLNAAGVGRGARVAVMADADVAGGCAVLGVLKAGASVAPIPDLVGADAVARMLDDCGVGAVFVSERMRGLLPPGLGAPVVAVETLMEGPDAPDAGAIVAPEDEFNIIYSSGTTGRPKGIVHSHAVRAAWARGVAPLAFPSGVRTLTTTPLCSNWTLCALIYTLWSGGCARMMSRFSPRALVDACRAFAPDNVYLVPIQVARLLEDEEVADELPTLPPSTKWCAGSRFPEAHKREILRLWPGGLIELYGMTEGAPSTLLLAHERPDKLHTVGRSDVEDGVKIIGEDGEELPVGAAGEVVGRAVDVTSGYHNDPAATEALVWRDGKGDAFLRSGDIGRLDEDGFLQILDRKKDMIISGGFNIYAADLEAVLSQHPAVRQAAAFAAPSDRWGETPAAAVVLHEGTGVGGEDLRRWANARLGPLQHISAVHILDDLPRGALGKVLKGALRALYGERPS